MLNKSSSQLDIFVFNMRQHFLLLPHISGCKMRRKNDHEAAQRFGPGGISQHVSKNDVSKHGRLGLQDGLCSEVSGKLNRGLGAVAAR